MEGPDSKRQKVGSIAVADKKDRPEPVPAEHEVVIEEGPVVPDLAVQGNLKQILIRSGKNFTIILEWLVVNRCHGRFRTSS